MRFVHALDAIFELIAVVRKLLIQSRPFVTLRARSLTSPSFVNLQALLNRLSSICRSRWGAARRPRTTTR